MSINMDISETSLTFAEGIEENDKVDDQTRTESNGVIEHNILLEETVDDKENASLGFQVVTIVSCMLSIALSIGTGNCLSVVYAQLIRDFDEDRSTVSLVQGTFQGLVAVGGILWGYPVTRLGYGSCVIIGGSIGGIAIIASAFATNVPTIIALVGVVAGAAFGILYLGPFVVAGQISKKYKTAVIGFVSVGSSFGMFTMTALAEALLEEYLWNGTLLIIGVICLNAVPFGMIMKISEKAAVTDSKINERKSENRLFYNIDLFKKPLFWVLMVNSLILASTSLAESRFLVDMAILKGFERQTGAFFITMIGTSNLLGGLTGSASKVIFKLKSSVHMTYWILLMAATHVLVIYLDSYAGLLVTSLLNGLCIGNLFAHVAVTLYEIYGDENYATSFAFWNIFKGVGNFLGGVCGGLIFDKTKNYDLLFQICTGLSVFYSMSFIGIFISLRMNENKKKYRK